MSQHKAIFRHHLDLRDAVPEEMELGRTPRMKLSLAQVQIQD